jgi:hypothetical protein
MQNGTQVEKEEMQERLEPRRVKFATGDVVEGVLTQIERVSIDNKPAVRYTVESESGEQTQFLGTYQLNAKLRASDKGHKIEIRCVGEDVTVKRGDNCMKVFEVMVSKNPVRSVAFPLVSNGTQTLEITDADIPF